MPETIGTSQGNTADSSGSRQDALNRRIATGVTRARLAIAWEDLWPRVIWPLGVVLSFVALSWLGLWTLLPDLARIAGLLVFATLLLGSLLTLRGWRYPDRAAGLIRIEQTSGLDHRPLQTLDDTLPAGADTVTRALWEAHRQRLVASVGALRVGLPQPGVDRADRYALRVVVALLLFVGYFAAGDTRLDRIRGAFRPFAHGSTVEARLDAWVTPPDYTGKPAILLTADGGPPVEPDGTIRAPQASSLVIRASGLTGTDPTLVMVTEQGSNQPKPLQQKAADASTDAALASSNGRPPATVEFELKLLTSSDVTVARGGTQLAHWRFTVDVSTPPVIKFIGSPEPQASGTLKMTYEVADDYGVVSAEAHFEPAPDSFPVTSNAASVRALVTPPDFALSLPSGHAKSGQATSFRDLTAHPWAGAKVRVTLVARNEAGLEGRSETKEITLPARNFTKPLARALIEQRRILALDANRQPQVNDAFDALLIGPEHFYDSSAVFLGVTEIYRTLLRAHGDDQLRDALGLMWDVATGIEDGNLTQAEKAVRDAEEALRKALDQGASDKDIAKLTQDLRDALDKYMHELAEAARNNPSLQRQASPNQRILRQQDLNRMLDHIENLAKTGSRDAARQMLSELQRMMENLQQGESGDSGGEQQQSEQNDALDKLGEMIQRQEQLMDKTHRLDRNGDQTTPNGRPQRPQQPMTDEQRQQALKDLEKNQGDLKQALKDLRDKLAQQGFGKKPKPGQGKADKKGGGEPGSEADKNAGGQSDDEGDDGPFGRAGEAMGDAKDSLGQGETGDAVDSQGRAIDQLREGAKKLIDEMAQQQSKNGRTGFSQSNQAPGDDPLGRPRRSSGPQDNSAVKVPDEIDTQRAREVLEAIRKRLSESMRPRFELDYLERLLQGE